MFNKFDWNFENLEGFDSFEKRIDRSSRTVIYEDDSPLIQSIKRKMIAEESAKPKISRYELKELLSYHKREISYGDFNRIANKIKGINYSDIVDTLEEVSKDFGAERFNVSRNFGMIFIHIWFRRTDSGYGSKYKLVGDRFYKYTFTFDESEKLVKLDYGV